MASADEKSLPPFQQLARSDPPCWLRCFITPQLSRHQRLEDLAIERFVAELAADWPIVTILPRRSRLDIERFHPDPRQPFADSNGGELAAAVGPDVIPRPVQCEDRSDKLTMILKLCLGLTVSGSSPSRMTSRTDSIGSIVALYLCHSFQAAC